MLISHLSGHLNNSVSRAARRGHLWVLSRLESDRRWGREASVVEAPPQRHRHGTSSLGVKTHIRGHEKSVTATAPDTEVPTGNDLRKSPSVGHSEASDAAFPEARSALPALTASPPGSGPRHCHARARSPDHGPSLPPARAADRQLANTTHPSLHGTKVVPSISLLFLFFSFLNELMWKESYSAVIKGAQGHLHSGK